MTLREPNARGRGEIVVSSRRHVMTETASGYTIWRAQDGTERPIANYPATDDGLDEAFARWDVIHRRERRGTFLTVLAWIVAALGIAWFGFTTIIVSRAISMSIGREQELDEWSSYFWAVWVPALMQVLSTVFYVAVAVYVVLWLQLRRARD